jgi:long-chain acyl-CoA synthetase
VVGTLVELFAAARDGRACVLGPVTIPDTPEPGTWLLAATSGSTGHPRTIARSARSWVRSFPPLAELAELRADDVVALTGPLGSTLHLCAAVHTLWLGATLTDRLDDATAAHLVPTRLLELLDDPPPMLRTVVVAGAPLPDAVADRCTTWGVLEYYGAAELSFVAARRPPDPFWPFPGVQVRERDGRLQARSEYLAFGPTDEGWRGVGDLGSVHADGTLEVRGRGDAAVLTGGHTVVAEDVEATLTALPGIREAAVVGLPHPRLGQLVAAAITTDDLAAARQAARTALTGPALPRIYRAVDRLPRTPAGKIDRAAVRALFDGSGDSTGPRPARQ